jgi:uncharacterized phage-associated protein
MPSAIDVAEYLVRLASRDSGEDRDPISNLRLQKLLYYCQGWHLAVFGEPLFTGRIEAWTLGPVVREVYDHYRDNFDIRPENSVGTLELADRSKKIVEWVWERYKRFSATALKDKTHQEAPWVETRGDLPADARSELEITPEALRAYFLHLYADHLHRQDPRIDPATWVKSDEAFATGQARSAEEILREIRRRRTEGHRVTNQ